MGTLRSPQSHIGMKTIYLGLCLLINVPHGAFGQDDPAAHSGLEQDIIDLSRQKWHWMAEQKVDSLAALFHEDAVFVHMGGTMSRDQELGVIQSGRIHYKQADIHEVSVRIIDRTAILLNRITLLAVVGGNEVTNPFEVTEVYVQKNDTWRLASLSFTRLLR